MRPISLNLICDVSGRLLEVTIFYDLQQLTSHECTLIQYLDNGLIFESILSSIDDLNQLQSW